MISYAAQQVSPQWADRDRVLPVGVAHRPQADRLPADQPVAAGRDLGAIHPVSAFFGMVSPPIMLLGIPGLVFAGYRIARRRRAADGRAPADLQLAIVAVAWFVGTWVPFALQSLIDQRTSYLYYMVIVMPGVYVAAPYRGALGWRRRVPWLSGLTVAWGLAVLAAVVLMYPFVAAF